MTGARSDAPACTGHDRYDPADFHSAPVAVAHAAYVVGGLYGNPEALREIQRMQAEEARRGVPVRLVFNGDHNWFDVDAADFWQVNDAVLSNLAIRGNVEAGLAGPADAGCGCDYPNYVEAIQVERANAIMQRLHGTAARFPGLRSSLAALPAIRVLEVGGLRIGICHGDAQSLAGWGFAAERLGARAACSRGEAVAPTPPEVLARWFRAAGVRAFASSHTCLPRAVVLDVDGESCAIVNNGAAGMPNIAGTRYGIVTRISSDPSRPPAALYGCTLGGVRFDAVPVAYDHEAWLQRFLANWPPGSPAHDAYHARLVAGPDHTLEEAAGPGFTVTAR